jgi:hypothetical protein
MELVNIPVPVPLTVVLSTLSAVGNAFLLQQTPRDVTVELPSLVIVPPQVAVVDVTLLAVVVVSVGTTLGASFLQLKVSVRSKETMTK